MRRTTMLGLLLTLTFTSFDPLCRGASLRLEQVSDVPFMPPAVLPGDAPQFNSFAQFGGELYFASSDDESGESQLFKTNGQAVVPLGVRPPIGAGGEFIEFENNLYFDGRGDSIEIELYRTNGSGVTKVDLSNHRWGSQPHRFTVVGDKLYFFATPSETSDAGRLSLMSMAGGVVQTVADVETLTGYWWHARAGDALVFPANGPGGYELHGIVEGAALQLADLHPGAAGSNPRPGVEWNGQLYFTALSAQGRALYRTDGQTVHTIPTDLAPTALDSVTFMALGDYLYFAAEGDAGWELFRTDGQSVTPFDLNPGPASSEPELYGSDVLDGMLLVGGRGPQGPALFVVDGEGNVARRMDFNSSSPGFPVYPMVEFEGDAFLQGYGAHGADLFKTDGAELVELDVLPADQPGTWLDMLAARPLEGRLYIPASTADGFELVWTDGTNTGSFDVNPGAADSWPTDLQVVGDALVFRARGPQGDAVYVIENHTLQKIGDLSPNWFTLLNGEQALGSSTTAFARLGDDLYFLGNTPQGFRLHRVTAAVPEPRGLCLAAGAVLAVALMRHAMQCSRLAPRDEISSRGARGLHSWE